MGAGQDFNYKVALASGLKSLQAGRLRQAEEQFRYLIAKFPGSDGGHRGLAKVLVELEDRAAALTVLRDGAAAMARGANRSGAITMLRDAVMLDPLDLSAHRRLVAAHSLAGDPDAALAEVERYVDLQISVNDPGRARLETAYAIRSLGRHERLVALAARSGLPADDLPAVAEPASSGDAGLAPAFAETEVVRPAWQDVVARPATQDEAARPAWQDEVARPAWEDQVPIGAATAGAPTAAPVEAVAPAAPADATTLEARAAELLARRDPRAAPAALEAAAQHLAEGHVHAASDLLLQLVATGLASHEAQRMMVEVAGLLGRRDVAEAKRVLLTEAQRIGGREGGAEQVGRLPGPA